MAPDRAQVRMKPLIKASALGLGDTFRLDEVGLVKSG